MDENRWPAIFDKVNWAFQGCARIGSYILIAGGNKGWGGGPTSITKIIDIATRTVRHGGNLAWRRAGHHLATVTSGGLTKTFALGGGRSYGFGPLEWTSSVEEWDEDNLKWKPAGTNLKEAKGYFAATAVPLSVICPSSG